MAAYLARRLQLQRAVRHETCEERHEPEALQLQQLQQLLVEIVAWLSVRGMPSWRCPAPRASCSRPIRR